jgi:predicted GNAT superfamily acetyltransferase
MVRSDARGQGVGEALKQAQAALVMELGVPHMCWTFDPLRAVNAHLNLHKLGASSHEYIEQAYAATSSSRDAHMPADRLWVEWHLGRQVPERRNAEYYADAVRVLHNLNGVPDQAFLNTNEREVIAEIPDDIDVVRDREIKAARMWRYAVRAVFTHYFQQGYAAEDYLRGVGYILRHGSDA